MKQNYLRNNTLMYRINEFERCLEESWWQSLKSASWVYVSVTLLIIMTSAGQETYGRKAFLWHVFRGYSLPQWRKLGGVHLAGSGTFQQLVVSSLQNGKQTGQEVSLGYKTPVTPLPPVRPCLPNVPWSLKIVLPGRN